MYGSDVEGGCGRGADSVQESVRQPAGRGEGEGGFGKERGWCSGRSLKLGVMRCLEKLTLVDGCEGECMIGGIGGSVGD